MTNRFSLLLLLIANVMFATEFSAVKLTVGAVGPVMLPFWQLLLGSIVLVPIFYLDQKHTHRTLSSTLRELIGPTNLTLFAVCVVTAVSTNVSLMWGIKRAQASDAAVLSLTIPILAIASAWMFLGECLTARGLAAVLIAILGAVELSSPQFRAHGIKGAGNLHGGMLILISCASSSVYTVVSKPLLKRFTPCELLIPTWMTAVIAFAIGISLLRPGLWTEVQTYKFRTWLGVLIVGLVSKGLAMLFYLSALKHLPVAKVVLSIYLIPFLGVLFAVVFVHESISLRIVVGGLLVLMGNLVMTDLPRISGKDATLHP